MFWSLLILPTHGHVTQTGFPEPFFTSTWNKMPSSTQPFAFRIESKVGFVNKQQALVPSIGFRTPPKRLQDKFEGSWDHLKDSQESKRYIKWLKMFMDFSNDSVVLVKYWAILPFQASANHSNQEKWKKKKKLGWTSHKLLYIHSKGVTHTHRFALRGQKPKKLGANGLGDPGHVAHSNTLFSPQLNLLLTQYEMHSKD